MDYERRVWKFGFMFSVFVFRQLAITEFVLLSITNWIRKLPKLTTVARRNLASTQRAAWEANKFRTTTKHFCEPKNGPPTGHKITSIFCYSIVGLMEQLIFHESGGRVAKCLVTALDCEWCELHPCPGSLAFVLCSWARHFNLAVRRTT